MSDALRFEFVVESSNGVEWDNYVYGLSKAEDIPTEDSETDFIGPLGVITFEDGLSFDEEVQVRRMSDDYDIRIHEIQEVSGFIP